MAERVGETSGRGGGVRSGGGGGGGRRSEGGGDLPLLQCPTCREDYRDTKSLHSHVEGTGVCLKAMGLTREGWRVQFRKRQKQLWSRQKVSALSQA